MSGVHKIKQTHCVECSTEFDWTTYRPERCIPCRKEYRRKWQESKRRAKGMKAYSGYDRDTLPQVDWVMEKQFSRFFELMGVRYSSPKDVSKVSDAGHYRRSRA